VGVFALPLFGERLSVWVWLAVALVRRRRDRQPDGGPPS
jgi:hypothetical protein